MTVTYSQMENKILELMNQLRVKPSFYVPILEQMKTKYEDNHFINMDMKAKMVTKEGSTAVVEAINVLKNLSTKLQPLKRNNALDLAARRFQTFLEQSGNISPVSGEMKLEERVKNYMKEGGIVAENICFGCVNAHNVINQFLVSDGIPQKIHRDNILNQRFTHVGISLGEHPKYKFSCVVVFFGPQEGGNTELIDLYNTAYDPKIIPKVEGAKTMTIAIELDNSNNNNIKKNLIYKFRLENGEEVEKKVSI